MKDFTNKLAWQSRAVQELTFTGYKVFNLWFDDAVKFSAGSAIISERSGGTITPSNCAKAFRELVEKEFLKPIGKVGGRMFYVLGPLKIVCTDTISNESGVSVGIGGVSVGIGNESPQIVFESVQIPVPVNQENKEEPVQKKITPRSEIQGSDQRSEFLVDILPETLASIGRTSIIGLDDEVIRLLEEKQAVTLDQKQGLANKRFLRWSASQPMSGKGHKVYVEQFFEKFVVGFSLTVTHWHPSDGVYAAYHEGIRAERGIVAKELERLASGRYRDANGEYGINGPMHRNFVESNLGIYDRQTKALRRKLADIDYSVPKMQSDEAFAAFLAGRAAKPAQVQVTT